jgi:hypothetical protein
MLIIMSDGAAGLVFAAIIIKMKQDREPPSLSLALLSIISQLNFSWIIVVRVAIFYSSHFQKL